MAIAAGLWLLLSATTKQLRDELRENLQKVALGTAATVDGELHRTLVNPDQNLGPDYMRCVAPLAAIRNSIPGVKYTYTAVLDADGQTVRFVLDSAPVGDGDGDGVDDHAKLGDVYDDATDTLRRVLLTGVADCEQEPYTDDWGTFMTAYAPIRDASGKVVAVVGVDMTAQTYLGRIGAVENAAAIGLIPGVLISIGVAMVVYRGRRSAQREEELIELRNRRLRDMVDNLPAAAVYLSLESMTLNKAAAALLGYGQAHFATIDDWFVQVFPGRADQVRAAHERQRAAGFAAPDVLPVVCADGRTRLVEFTGYASEDSEVWLLNDITEQAAMQERFRVVFEHSTGVHLLVDDRGIFDCNAAAMSLMETLLKPDLIGRSLESLCPPVQSGGIATSAVLEGLIRASRESGPVRAELELRSSKGRAVPVAASFTHVTLDARPVTLVVMHDLSAAKLAECDLRRAMVAAEEASRAKSDFLANMSHEIRTPMTAILGYADLLLDQALSEDVRRLHVETIRANGDHLLAIINDILDLSKIEAGKMTVEQCAVDPAQVCVQVHDLMQPRAYAKELSLQLRFDTPVPRTISTDPTRLRQILMNLVGNALKFTQQGSVTVRVARIETSSQPAAIEFSIIDSGIGMSQSQLSGLFQPFSQADTSTTRKFGGTGLGLTISRHLAQLLGGDITVTSVPGGGSTFRVRVPCGGPSEGQLHLVNADQVRADTLVRATVGITTERQLDGSRILLAEDGLDNQRLICFHLKKAGGDGGPCLQRSDCGGQGHRCAAERSSLRPDSHGHADARARWVWRVARTARSGVQGPDHCTHRARDERRPGQVHRSWLQRICDQTHRTRETAGNLPHDAGADGQRMKIAQLTIRIGSRIASVQPMYPKKPGIFTPALDAIVRTMKLGPLPM
jgi:signal transduction histidine kinase